MYIILEDGVSRAHTLVAALAFSCMDSLQHQHNRTHIYLCTHMFILTHTSTTDREIMLFIGKPKGRSRMISICIYTDTYFNYSICQADIQLCVHTHICIHACRCAYVYNMIWLFCIFVDTDLRTEAWLRDLPGRRKVDWKRYPPTPPPPSYGVTTMHWASSIAKALLKWRLMFAGLVTGWRRSVRCLVFRGHFPLVQFKFVPRNLSFWIWRRPIGCLCRF